MNKSLFDETAQALYQAQMARDRVLDRAWADVLFGATEEEAMSNQPTPLLDGRL